MHLDRLRATVLRKAYESCSECRRHNIECKALAARKRVKLEARLHKVKLKTA